MFVVNSAIIGNADKTRAEMTKFHKECMQLSSLLAICEDPNIEILK